MEPRHVHPTDCCIWWWQLTISESNYLFSILLHPQRKNYLTYLLLYSNRQICCIIFLDSSCHFVIFKKRVAIEWSSYIHITNFIMLNILSVDINNIAHISQVWDVRKTISPVREFVGHSKGFISPFVHGFFPSLLMYTNFLYFFLILHVIFASTRCNCYVLVPLW